MTPNTHYRTLYDWQRAVWYAQQHRKIGTSESGLQSPTEIANLEAYLRYDVGVQTSGSNVTQWNDQSGNGNHALGGAGHYPTLGAGGIVFNGSSQYLTIDSLASIFSGADKPFTLILVKEETTTAFTDRPFSTGNSGTNVPTFSIYYDNPPDNYVFNLRDNTNTVADHAFGTVTTNRTLLTIVMSGTTVSIWEDNTPVLTDAAANVGTVSVNRVSIGVLRRSDLGGYFHGNIQAVLVYSVALSATDRAALDTWLMSEFSI